MNAVDPPVVLGVDGTRASAGVIRNAVKEAGTVEAEFRIVHVSPVARPMSPLRPMVPIDLGPYGRTALEAALAEVLKEEPGLHATTTLVRGARVRGKLVLVEAGAVAR